MHVIGTAGHVDHGKSTLIAALTGINPDRLKEEQEREMTIDLGFAWLTLPGGEEIGIVDVPGHRDFIENMLAGIGGIDLCLLVIAADEGVMPQTLEHLAIIDLLQIKDGLVVLTKLDLIKDLGWLDLVEADVRKTLHGTVLQDAPILRVSARTRAGFPELLQYLDKLLEMLPSRPDLGKPRLPVDRVFSIPGFGTVVTGTLSDGQLSLGDEVEILPSGLHSRIRGLQTHKKKTGHSMPGSRLAVNLSGVDLEQIRRGEVVTHPGLYTPTQRLDVQFRLLADVTAPLHHHTEVKVFLSASETVANVRLLGTEKLNPGETAFLQLELRDPLVTVRGDHFILRRPSPGETIGGGRVLDPQPKNRHKRFDKNVLDALESISKGSPAELLLQASLVLGPAMIKDVFSRSGLEGQAAESGLRELLEHQQVALLEDVLISSPEWLSLKQALLAALAGYHEMYPLRKAMPREELKSRLKLMPRLFNLVIHNMADAGIIKEEGKWVSMPDHRVHLTPFQQVKVDKLMDLFASSPYSPPSIKECQVLVGEDVFSTLVETGTLLPVSNEVVFRMQDYQSMESKTLLTLQQRGQINLAEVRDIFQTSRKYVQPFLEYLDAHGLTIREGDFRRLKKKVADRSTIDWQKDSQSFDTVAELYDASRPEYPPELIDCAIEHSSLPQAGRILEIGSGTGKATLPFAFRGYNIHCLEPGRNLVAVASAKLNAYPKVTFEITRFEEWQVRRAEFDLVMAGSSFHWVSKQVGFTIANQALKPHGTLALFWNISMHFRGGLAEVLEAVYRERVPGFTQPHKNREALIQERYDDIAMSGYFGPVRLDRFPWSQTYRTLEYLALLNTYSDHLRLTPETRKSLFDGIALIIDAQGGSITREYNSILYTAQKRT